MLSSLGYYSHDDPPLPVKLQIIVTKTKVLDKLTEDFLKVNANG